jgi:hypothetical protein
VRKGKKTKRAWWVQVESADRERVFLFQVPLKLTLVLFQVPMGGKAQEVPTQ